LEKPAEHEECKQKPHTETAEECKQKPYTETAEECKQKPYTETAEECKQKPYTETAELLLGDVIVMTKENTKLLREHKH